MKDTEIEGIVTSDNTQTFILFHTGPNNSSLHGVWIVVHKGSQTTIQQNIRYNMSEGNTVTEWSKSRRT